MSALTLSLMAWGLVMVAAAGLYFAAAVRGGHMDDLEDTKFQMLREDENR